MQCALFVLSHARLVLNLKSYPNENQIFYEPTSSLSLWDFTWFVLTWINVMDGTSMLMLGKYEVCVIRVCRSLTITKHYNTFFIIIH